MTGPGVRTTLVAVGLWFPVVLAAGGVLAATRLPAPPDTVHRTFATPDAAVQALIEAVKGGNLDDVTAIFGPDSADLINSSDAATARQNRQIFIAAAAEGWRLAEQGGNRRTLIIGNEAWPFPVPLVKAKAGWQFDTAAGREEVLARRIGRNELGAIGICRTFVVAQLQYGKSGHDGKPAGRYAMTIRSDPGRENGLYWPAVRGKKLSPLGDLVAKAASEGRTVGEGSAAAAPFHGYHFKMLTSQGPHAAGGAKSYVVDGEMTGGFALLAWPAQYDASGVMTFVIGPDNVVWQKDLGPETATAAAAISAYDPDPASWTAVR